MKKTLFLVALMVLGFVVSAEAQTPASPTSRFGWEQAAPSLTVASAYRYDLELDGTLQAAPLAQVVCTGATSPFSCEAAIPAVTPAVHTARMRAADVTVTPAMLGDFSNVLTFEMRAIPATPTGFGIRPVPAPGGDDAPANFGAVSAPK